MKIMKKITAIFVIFVLVMANSAHAVESSQGVWCVIEQNSEQVIAAQGEGNQRFPAGLTKLMSYLLIFEALDAGTMGKSDMVTVSQNAAAKGGTSVFLDAGESYSVETLLKAAVVSSGNDATVALAEHLAGSESSFTEKMNQRGREMGLECYFADPTGMSVETKASAKELAVIAAELAEHRGFFEYSKIWTYTFVHHSGRETELTSSNKLIKNQQFDGMATGSAREAGYCLAASMPQSGSRFLCIVMNAENSDERFHIAGELLGTAGAAYVPYEIVKAGAKVKSINISGAREEVALYAAEDLSLLLPKDQDIRKSIHIREDLAAPLSAGEKAGELIITATDGTNYSVDLIVKQDVEEKSFKGALSRVLMLWLERRNEA